MKILCQVGSSSENWLGLAKIYKYDPERRQASSMILKHRRDFSRSAQLLLVLLIGFIAISVDVGAQYGAGNDMSAYGGHGGPAYQYDSGPSQEERPRLHLGIRLRIPAMKFELPRLSLPKITVSAKIRQPDGPRTINLPEINLDTSSKLSSQSEMNHAGGGDYGAGSRDYASSGSSSYRSAPSYPLGYGKRGQTGERTQTFSFSTGGEESHHDGRHYAPANYANGPVGGRSNALMYDGRMGSRQMQIPNGVDATNGEQSTNSNDIGFNQPVYLEAHPSNSRAQGSPVQYTKPVSSGAEHIDKAALASIQPTAIGNRHMDQHIAKSTASQHLHGQKIFHEASASTQVDALPVQMQQQVETDKRARRLSLFSFRPYLG